MMKKLLILMLVLGMASVANAAIVTFESGGSSAVGVDYLTGGVIVVDVKVDTAVNSGFQVTIGESTTSASHATSAVGTLNAGYTLLPTVGTSVDTMTNFGAGTPRYVLIHRISGTPAVGTPVAANAVSYSFNLTVPSGNLGDTFTLTGYAGSPSIGMPPYSYLVDGGAPASTNNLVVTLVPEPMTIALLGLGGLFLLRRRK